VSMVVATPKARLVKLTIAPQGEDPFSIGGSRRRATHYVVKVEIGGVAGLMAPLMGKQPRDTMSGFSAGRPRQSSNRRALSTWVAPFGGLSWRVRCGRECRPRI
jgi:hypothetical protein